MELRPLAILKNILVTAKALYSIESALLRAEMRECGTAASGIAIIGMVSFILWLAAILLLSLASVVMLMRSGLEPHVALGVAGAVVAALATICTATVMYRVNTVSFLPRKTMAQVRKDMKLLGNFLDDKAS